MTNSTGPGARETKRLLRGQIRALLAGMSAARRAEASVSACLLLEKQRLWQQANSILFYAPLAEELDVWPLLRDSLSAGKIVALPGFQPAANSYGAFRIQALPADVRDGRFGIREPAGHCSEVALKDVDLVLVPGLAFDARGGRLGRGKGFYDKLLALADGRTCGVAFDEQIVDEIPVEAHDIRMSTVLTPTRWIEREEREEPTGGINVPR